VEELIPRKEGKIDGWNKKIRPQTLFYEKNAKKKVPEAAVFGRRIRGKERGASNPRKRLHQAVKKLLYFAYLNPARTIPSRQDPTQIKQGRAI